MTQSTASSKTVALRVLLVLCSMLTGAHFLRFGGFWEALACAFPLACAFWPRLLPRVVIALGFSGALWVWADLAIRLIGLRMQFDQPYIRLSMILGAVWLTHLLGLVLLLGKSGDIHFGSWNAKQWVRSVVFLLVFAALSLAREKAKFPILLGERFWIDSGRFWVALFSVYGSAVSGLLLDGRRIRGALWSFFSALFFGQLLLGLVGFPDFLMTGKLHLPVPALIAAGPLYRGSGLFMPILLGISLLLVGPAWCSYLCYIGAWDDRLSRLGPKRPKALPHWAHKIRVAILAATLLIPLLLRLVEVSWPWALGIAAAFGLVGIAIMFILSRSSGSMVHCTAYCPIGLINNLLGRILPWRIHIDQDCTGCGTCSRACRYNALTTYDLMNKKPGLTCSLCGDCLPSCPHGHLGYTFPGLKTESARQVFITLVSALHTIFVAVARI